MSNPNPLRAHFSHYPSLRKKAYRLDALKRVFSSLRKKVIRKTQMFIMRYIVRQRYIFDSTLPLNYFYEEFLIICSLCRSFHHSVGGQNCAKRWGSEWISGLVFAAIAISDGRAISLIMVRPPFVHIQCFARRAALGKEGRNGGRAIDRLPIWVSSYSD